MPALVAGAAEPGRRQQVGFGAKALAGRPMARSVPRDPQTVHLLSLSHGLGGVLGPAANDIVTEPSRPGGGRGASSGFWEVNDKRPIRGWMPTPSMAMWRLGLRDVLKRRQVGAGQRRKPWL